MSVHLSPDSHPIDDIHLREPSTSKASTAAETLQMPKIVGAAAKSPLKNAKQLTGSPNQAVAKLAASLDQVTQDLETPPEKTTKSFKKTIGSNIKQMREHIASSDPQANEKLVKGARALAALGGAVLYGAGLLAGAAVNIAISGTSAVAGLCLSVIPIALVGVAHLLGYEGSSDIEHSKDSSAIGRSWNSFVKDSQDILKFAFSHAGFGQGVMRDVVFTMIQSIPIGITALGAGLLEFGTNKKVNSDHLTAGLLLTNKNLSMYFKKHFPESSAVASQTSSVSIEEDLPEDNPLETQRDRAASELPDIDSRNRSASGFTSNPDLDNQ